MAFNFRFEKVLRLKDSIEKEAAKAYAESSAAYYESMDELMKLKDSRDMAIIQRKELEMSGVRAAVFDSYGKYIEGNRLQCIKKIEEIKQRRDLMEEKFQLLFEARKQHKIYEKIKEKEKFKYRIGKEAKSLANLDEIGNTYFRRSR